MFVDTGKKETESQTQVPSRDLLRYFVNIVFIFVI